MEDKAYLIKWTEFLSFFQFCKENIFGSDRSPRSHYLCPSACYKVENLHLSSSNVQAISQPSVSHHLSVTHSVLVIIPSELTMLHLVSVLDELDICSYTFCVSLQVWSHASILFFLGKFAMTECL